MNKKIVNLLLIIIVLIMIAVNILIYINNHKEETNNNTNQINFIQENIVTNKETIQNTVNNKLENMPERNRIQTYFGTFMTYIENKNFENAYKLLNENFKNNYFSTIDAFEKYFENYPKNIAIKYTNIERQGEIFVLTVEINDMFDNETEPITKRIVIRENGLNDFKISFEV